MELIIKGEPKEIAALVLAVQERPNKSGDARVSVQDAIRDTLKRHPGGEAVIRRDGSVVIDM